MLGTALQFGGVRGGDDRFYIPVKARKNQNQRKPVQREKGGESESADSISDRELIASENGNPNESSYLLSKPSSVEPASNIDRFLESTTPLVPAQYLAKESFKEWSVYGAGVPLVLDQRQSVVQYYVPYLSAIQLYSQSDKKSNTKPRYTSEDSDGDYYRDSSSDGSSDSEFGKRTELFVAQGNGQYYKVSWMSVAWYPIYRIPTGPTLKDLDACFLTYHTLHTPLTGNGSTQGPILVYPNDVDGVPKISLPTFAMASYKLKGSIWTQNGVRESQLANSLLQDADNWLRQLQVNHPDYQFFKSHGTYHR
ncbi:hypothetical protein DEO72_LG5g278 [Vigna unguiculata]|uniref:Uncharacterized protein n=1 Tax=Vigna unguiculata TaxID=3917 RepID=A0A4D6LUG4_VIGUN|nr:hypothetical protein DEO72_LG5g278 [Vigna unguiculata]